MKYMFLLYGPEMSGPESWSEDDIKPWVTFQEEIDRRNAHVFSAPLHPSTTATTVRVRDGKAITTDGPFAETKEVLGGIYVLDCKDLDEALELAALIPGSAYGNTEVRPVVEMG